MFKRFLLTGVLLVFGLSAATLYARELPNFVDLVKENSPAVVNITTTREISAGSLLPEEFKTPQTEELFDELMKKFFSPDGQGGGLPFDFDSNASGSGFVYSADGFIVTNHHVVDGAKEIMVRFGDSRELPARLVGSDQRTDIALLKVEAEGLPVLKLGTSQDLQVGEWVLAIGSPFGFEHSATAGIVSAKERRLPDETYVPFIQTDVAINPGNSGGPLFNLEGRVVGINSQIYSRSGGFMGVSFAIPVDVASGVIKQLREKGSVSRGWIGIYIQEMDANLAQSFNMFKPEGALVAGVRPDGPAANVLKQGDVVLEFDGKAVKDASTLPLLVGETPIGRKVTVGVLRSGKRENITLAVGELPSESELQQGKTAERPRRAPVAGVLGMKVSPAEGGGVLVDEIIGEPARSAGIMTGDVITMLDGKDIDSPETFRNIAADIAAGKTVAILLQRNGSARFLALKIEPNARE